MGRRNWRDVGRRRSGAARSCPRGWASGQGRVAGLRVVGWGGEQWGGEGRGAGWGEECEGRFGALRREGKEWKSRAARRAGTEYAIRVVRYRLYVGFLLYG